MIGQCPNGLSSSSISVSLSAPPLPLTSCPSPLLSPSQVPEEWQAYVEDVDAERQMWLNSFYKAPLRLPSPAELSYIWDTRE